MGTLWPLSFSYNLHFSIWVNSTFCSNCSRLFYNLFSSYPVYFILFPALFVDFGIFFIEIWSVYVSLFWLISPGLYLLKFIRIGMESIIFGISNFGASEQYFSTNEKSGSFSGSLPWTTVFLARSQAPICYWSIEIKYSIWLTNSDFGNYSSFWRDPVYNNFSKLVYRESGK